MPLRLQVVTNEEGFKNFVTVAASWPTFRRLWKPAIEQLGLRSLRELAEVGWLTITQENKDTVLADLYALRQWIARPTQDDGEESVSRADQVAYWIDKLVRSRSDSVVLG